MANSMTLFRDEKDVVVANQQGLDEITKRLLGGGTNYKRISIKGGKFRMIVNGQEAARSKDSTLDVVVVNAAEHVSRQFYAKTFDPTSKVGVPDCWSNDGKKPDPRSVSPQGRTCDSCPKNIDGSGTNGRGRACRFSRRLAVVLANDVEHSDVYQIQLPATSLFGKAKDEEHMGLDAYVKHLAGYNYSITSVVTEMRFDENAEAPKLYFRGVRRLNENELAAAREKGQTEEAQNAITFNPGQMDMAKNEEVAAPPAPKEPTATPFKNEEVAEPTVRASKNRATPTADVDVENLLDAWETDD